MTDLALAPTPSAAPPDDLPTLDGSMAAGEAAFTLLRAQHRALEGAVPLVRAGDDALARKRMNIALGRLRAVLAVFGPALPARAPAQDAGLARLGAILEPVRELDVRIAQLARWSESAGSRDREALDAVVAELGARHERARRRAATGFLSAPARRALASVSRFLAAGPTKRARAARVPLLDLTPALLEREHRGLLAKGDALATDASTEALRVLRAACERMRYTVELVEPLYGKPVRRYRKPLLTVDDLLAAQADAAAGADLLREVGLSRKPRLPPAELLALGALAQQSEEWARDLRALLPDAWAKLDGRRWRRLLRAAASERTGKLDPRVADAIA